MENIKAIFLDFDWTLFDHKTRSFNKKGVEGLNIAAKKGIKLIINSARTYYSLKMLKTFDLIPISGFVVSNGGAAMIDDKTLYAHFIDDDIKNQLTNFLDKNNFSYILIGQYDSFIKVNNPKHVENFYNTFYEPYPLDISKYNQQQILSIQILSDPSDDEILKSFTDKFQLLYNRFSKDNVEVTIKEFYKSEGVNSIYKYLNLDKENCMAFGDDINDISMFNMVKYSICLGNGKLEAKQNAYYITDNIEDDGLYKALKHFNIID